MKPILYFESVSIWHHDDQRGSCWAKFFCKNNFLFKRSLVSKDHQEDNVWCDENPVLIDSSTLVPWSPLVPPGQPEYFTSVTNFGVAGSTWRGVVLSQSIRGGRTYLHAVECAGDLHVAHLHVARIYMQHCSTYLHVAKCGAGRGDLMGRPPTSPRLRPTSSLPLFQIGPNQINLNPNHADQQPIIALFSGQDELGEGKRVLDHFDETVTKPHSFLMLNVQCQLCLSKILGLLPGRTRLDLQLESLCHYKT